MFKCLCGGRSNANNNVNNKPQNNNNNNGESGNNMNMTISNYSNGTELSPRSKSTINSLHPGHGEAGGGTSRSKMKKIRSTSGATTPSPANHHINGLNKKNKNVITPSTTPNNMDTDNNNNNNMDTDNKDNNHNDDISIKSKSHSSVYTNPNKARTKHQRKRTHPYKSRDPTINISSPSSLNRIQYTTSHSHQSHDDQHSILSSSRKSQFQQQPTINDYYIYDNFEFSIQNFDFNSHYKFLIELAIKCLNMGPEILNPEIFFDHNEIKCVVAILHENNNKKVPTSYYRDIRGDKTRKRERTTIINNNNNDNNNNTETTQTTKDTKSKPLLHSHRREKEQVLLNNVIGFAICYPHSNCRPYPDSVWMIGWLCADNIRIRSYNSQYYVIEALIRQCFTVINPNSIKSLPEISLNLKAHLRENNINNNNNNNNNKMINIKGEKLSNLEEKDEDKGGEKNDDDKEEKTVTSKTRDNMEFNTKYGSKNDKKKKKKPRDKGIGIYAPYYHKKAQQLYESLGFEKIAKIGNYYTTDQQFFDGFYKSDDNKENEVYSNSNSPSNKSNKSEDIVIINAKKMKFANDAYLYCRGDLAHCRLLLGMEYFNYKKWPKPPSMLNNNNEGKSNKDEDDEKQIKKEKTIESPADNKNDKNKKDTDSKDRDGKKKRNYGPKILEEYLQSRIADYHAKQQKEQLLLRKSQNNNNNRHRNHGKSYQKQQKQQQQQQQQQQATTSAVAMANIANSTNTAHSVATLHANSSNGNMHHIPSTSNNPHHVLNTHTRKSSKHHPHHPSHHQSHRTSHYSSTGNVHQHANSNQFDTNLMNQYRASQYHDKRIRFKPLNSNTSGHTGHSSHHSSHHDVNANTHNLHNAHNTHKNDNNNAYIVSHGDHRGYKGFREQQPTRYYYQENVPSHPPNSTVDDNISNVSSPNVANSTLSPNQLNHNGIHHKNSSIISDVGSHASHHTNASINTVNTINTVKSSRHSSIANSQITHHYHGSGHYYHPHFHHQRPTYTASSGGGALTAQSSGHSHASHASHAASHRPSVTPTPTYDITHSQAVYYPHISNVSTVTYTQASDDKIGNNGPNGPNGPNATNATNKNDQNININRGNSFYSMPTSSNASHHSHQHHPMQSHHSTHSNASIHSDPYIHSSNYHHGHPQHYIHPSHPNHPSHHNNKYNHHQNDKYDDPYNTHNIHRHSAHHKHHDSYNDDHPYNNHHHSTHKVRNKRYRQSSRHKKPQ